ncbi:prolyl oligopeptidase family protein, partial [Vibrio parahaemolyticus V-223/04]
WTVVLYLQSLTFAVLKC